VVLALLVHQPLHEDHQFPDSQENNLRNKNSNNKMMKENPPTQQARRQPTTRLVPNSQQLAELTGY